MNGRRGVYAGRMMAFDQEHPIVRDTTDARSCGSLARTSKSAAIVAGLEKSLDREVGGGKPIVDESLQFDAIRVMNRKNRDFWAARNAAELKAMGIQ
jgi:hypothetical protein